APSLSKTRKPKSKKNAKKAKSKIEKTNLDEKQGRVKLVASPAEHPFEAHPSLLQIRVGLVKQRTAGIDKYFQLKGKPAYLKAYERSRFDSEIAEISTSPFPEENEFMQIERSLNDRSLFKPCLSSNQTANAPRPTARSHRTMSYPPVLCQDLNCRNCKEKCRWYIKQLKRLQQPPRNMQERLATMICFLFLLAAAKYFVWQVLKK
ncbi:unnamed protein product, partial [Oikopleura dioica]